MHFGEIGLAYCAIYATYQASTPAPPLNPPNVSMPARLRRKPLALAPSGMISVRFLTGIRCREGSAAIKYKLDCYASQRCAAADGEGPEQAIALRRCSRQEL